MRIPLFDNLVSMINIVIRDRMLTEHLGTAYLLGKY